MFDKPELSDIVIGFSTDFYSVKKDDNLWNIAESNNVTLDDILKTNPKFTQNGRNPERIYPGEQVYIRGILIKQGCVSACACALAQKAKSKVGSKKWSKSSFGSQCIGWNHYKCNLFVYDMATDVGMSVPTRQRTNKIGQECPRIPLAQEWADPNYPIDGWKVLGEKEIPQPGDIVAIINEGSTREAGGHVGIVSEVITKNGEVIISGKTISARSDKVVENNLGFGKGKNPVFRRYVGKCE